MAEKKKKDLLSTFGSDVNGITGQGPLTDDDQSGLDVSAQGSPDASTTAPVDTGNAPMPDTQAPGPPPSQPSTLPPPVQIAQNTPPPMPAGPPPMPLQAPPQGGSALPPPPQIGGPQAPPSAAPPPPGLPPPPQIPANPNAARIGQVAQNVIQPEPPEPHPSTWRQVAGGLLGAFGGAAGRNLAPLAEYGSKGLEQARRHEEWQKNLPQQVRLADTLDQIQARADIAQENHELTQQQRNEQVRRDIQAEADRHTKEVDAQQKEIAEFVAPAKGGRFLQAGQDVPDGWSQVPSTSYDAPGTKRIVPALKTITAEMAGSELGKHMGLKAGDPMTVQEYNRFMAGTASLIGKSKPTPQTADQITQFANQYAPPDKYPGVNQRLKMDLMEANLKGDEAAGRAAQARASEQIAAQDREEKARAEAGAASFVDPKTGTLVRVRPGQAVPQGAVSPSGLNSENVKTDETAAKAKQAQQDAQKEYTIAQSLAANPSPTNDVALLMRYIGATKPDSLGKLRLNQNEVKMVMNTRSSFGDLEALAQRVQTGQSLTPKQRQDMLNTMRVLSGVGLQPNGAVTPKVTGVPTAVTPTDPLGIR